MDVIVVLTLPVQDGAAVVFIFLIVEARLSQVWEVNSTVDCIYRNKGWLHRNDTRSAVWIIRVGILVDFKAIGCAVSIGINAERIGAGIIGVHKCACSGLNAIKQTVPVRITVIGISSGRYLCSIEAAVVIGIVICRIRFVSIFVKIGNSVLIEISSAGKCRKVVDGIPLGFPSIWQSILVGVIVKPVKKLTKALTVCASLVDCFNLVPCQRAPPNSDIVNSSIPLSIQRSRILTDH